MPSRLMPRDGRALLGPGEAVVSRRLRLSRLEPSHLDSMPWLADAPAPARRPPGAASVPFIAIDPRRRFRGLGGEAALAIERDLRRKLAVDRVYAPVPDGRG